MRLKDIFGIFREQKEESEKEKRKKLEERWDRLYGRPMTHYYMVPSSGTFASDSNEDAYSSDNDIKPEDYF